MEINQIKEGEIKVFSIGGILKQLRLKESKKSNEGRYVPTLTDISQMTGLSPSTLSTFDKRPRLNMAALKMFLDIMNSYGFSLGLSDIIQYTPPPSSASEPVVESIPESTPEPVTKPAPMLQKRKMYVFPYEHIKPTSSDEFVRPHRSPSYSVVSEGEDDPLGTLLEEWHLLTPEKQAELKKRDPKLTTTIERMLAQETKMD